MLNLKLKNKKAYTILEIVIYVALFALLSVAVTNSLLVMIKSFTATSVQQDFLKTVPMMERITREIKQASNVTSVSVSDILLTSTNNPEFKLSGTNLQLWENSTLTGNLNPTNISVNSLSFVVITTAQGKAVKIQFSVTDTKDKTARSETFYSTAVLRGIY